MNKHIKLLVEGIFDDDFMDLIGDEDNMANQISDRIDFEKIIKILENNMLNNTYYFGSLPKTATNINYKLIGNNTIQFYYIDKDEGELLINNIYFREDRYNNININEIQEFFNLLYQLDINNVLNGLNIIFTKQYTNDILNMYKYTEANNIDFKNIIFLKYSLENVNCKNLLVDQKKELDKNTYNICSFSYCMFDDTCIIKEVKSLRFNSCFNINNFSFIKNIRLEFLYNIIDKLNIPKSYSCIGLPQNNYNFILSFDGKCSSESYNDMKLFSLKGISDNLKNITVRVLNPFDILYNFSFEGITESMIMSNKFNFTARNVGSKYSHTYIQLGPFKILHKGRKWNPTKPLYLSIIKAQDWFLDIWKADSGQPHKEYIEAETVNKKELEKIKIKELKKQDKLEQLKQDDAEDLSLMIDNIKKYINTKDRFYSANKHYVYHISDITDNKIKLTYVYIYRITNTYIKNYTFELFVEFIRKNNIYTGDGTNLIDLIVVPVLERREKINKKRKTEEKKNKKILKKLKEKVKTEEKKSNLNIEIIDYSEKAIALFGDTYTIKEKLKELGAKYNSRLKYGSSIKPGWILSKRKEQDIKNYIDDL